MPREYDGYTFLNTMAKASSGKKSGENLVVQFCQCKASVFMLMVFTEVCVICYPVSVLLW